MLRYSSYAGAILLCYEAAYDFKRLKTKRIAIEFSRTFLEHMQLILFRFQTGSTWFRPVQQFRQLYRNVTNASRGPRDFASDLHPRTADQQLRRRQGARKPRVPESFRGRIRSETERLEISAFMIESEK